VTDYITNVLESQTNGKSETNGQKACNAFHNLSVGKVHHTELSNLDIVKINHKKVRNVC